MARRRLNFRPMRPFFWLSLTVALACGCGTSSETASLQTSNPTDPINAAGPLGKAVTYAPAPPTAGFPESESVLAGYLASWNQTAMRRHAWSIWASLTSATSSGVPVMMTWYQNSEVFGDGNIAQPRLLDPQFLFGPKDSLGEGNPPCSFNVYNQAYRDHVRAQGYEWRNTLTDLVGQAPNVVDFPTDAVVAKLVWWPVRHDGLTAFPVWDHQPTRPITWGSGIGLMVDQGFFGSLSPAQQAELKGHEFDGNEWGTFRRVVAIDPNAAAAGKPTQIEFFDPDDVSYATNATRQARVVPLNDFYHLRINDAETVAKLNDGLLGEVTQRFWGRAFTQEDSLALVAVHITTREARDWVWTTYWWHDEPEQGAEGADRPGGLNRPFDRYVMDVAQSADIPTAPDNGPHITYNPYLEGGFARGVQSNCLGCHQRAGWTPEGSQNIFPVHRGSLADNDPSLAGVLRTHFLWSLVFRPRPQTPPALGSPEPLHDLNHGVIVDPE